MTDLRPIQQRILERLRKGPLPSSAFAEVGTVSKGSLKVSICHLRGAGHNIVCERPNGKGTIGRPPGTYVLTEATV